nr:hypothetical protein [Paraburkholderia sp. HD33-4]
MSQTLFSNRKDELVARLIPFLQEVKDMTASMELEQWLNAKYGVESESLTFLPAGRIAFDEKPPRH